MRDLLHGSLFSQYNWSFNFFHLAGSHNLFVQTQYASRVKGNISDGQISSVYKFIEISDGQISDGQISDGQISDSQISSAHELIKI